MTARTSPLRLPVSTEEVHRRCHRPDQESAWRFARGIARQEICACGFYRFGEALRRAAVAAARTSSPGVARGYLPRTVITGHVARATTRSATLPTKNFAIPFRPCV